MYVSPVVPCLCPDQGFEPETLAYLGDALTAELSPPPSTPPDPGIFSPRPCLILVLLKWILVVYACAQGLTEV